MQTKKLAQAKNTENVRNGRKGGQTTRQLLALGRAYAKVLKVDPAKPLPARLRKRLAVAA